MTILLINLLYGITKACNISMPSVLILLCIVSIIESIFTLFSVKSKKHHVISYFISSCGISVIPHFLTIIFINHTYKYYLLVKVLFNALFGISIICTTILFPELSRIIIILLSSLNIFTILIIFLKHRHKVSLFIQ